MAFTARRVPAAPRFGDEAVAVRVVAIAAAAVAAAPA
jgi:hypothetical protein